MSEDVLTATGVARSHSQGNTPTPVLKQPSERLVPQATRSSSNNHSNMPQRNVCFADDDDDFMDNPVSRPQQRTHSSPMLASNRSNRGSQPYAVASIFTQLSSRLRQAPRPPVPSHGPIKHKSNQPATYPQRGRECSQNQDIQNEQEECDVYPELDLEDQPPKKMQKKGPRINARYCPGDVIFTAAMLTGLQLDEVDNLGFGKLLTMKVDALESRDMLPWLIDRTDLVTMIITVGPTKKIQISSNSISLVLRLPNVGTNLNIHSWKEGVSVKKKLYAELGLEKEDNLNIYHMMEDSI